MKKKQFVRALVIFSFLITGLSSCNSFQTQNNTTKPDAIGGTDEVLVVLQNHGQWNGPVGEIIRKYFQANIYGLPQSEPVFKILHIDKSQLTEPFKTQKDIFFVNIDPEVKEPKIEIKKDVWAAPQLVFYLTAPSEQSFVDVFKDRHNLFIERIMQDERMRIQHFNRTSLSTKVIQKIQSAFGFSFEIPTGYYVAKTVPGFMWIRHEETNYSQGIMIITTPYSDTAQFSRDNILAQIQKYQRIYIPGPSSGSYMTLDRENMVPKATTIYDFPTKYAVKIIGLWRVENDFMGGPFASYTFLNQKNNQIVTCFGYVYYPNHKKRNFLLRVESIFYTLNLTPSQQAKAKR